MNWFEDKQYPFSDWRYEVASGDTKRDYVHWVLASYESEGVSPPPETRSAFSELMPEVADEPVIFNGTLDLTDTPERKEAWEEEVNSANTRLGYFEWRVHQAEENWNT